MTHAYCYRKRRYIIREHTNIPVPTTCWNKRNEEKYDGRRGEGGGSGARYRAKGTRVAREARGGNHEEENERMSDATEVKGEKKPDWKSERGCAELA